MRLTNYEKGVIFIGLSTLAWSGSGVFARSLSTDAWTAIVVRSFFGGLALLLPSFFLEGGWSKRQWLSAFSPIGILMVAINVVSQVSFIEALYLTSVANVAVIYATAPFIAALLAWVLLGQRAAGRTIVAGLVCLLGVAVIVGVSPSGQNANGNLLALLMTATFALIIVVPRIKPGVAVLFPTIIGAFLTAAVVFPFASLSSLDARNCILLAAFGANNYSLAFVLFMAGVRRVPPAESALILTLETVLTPTWVWLLFDETPAPTTLLGGAIIVVALVWHTISDVRRARAQSHEL